MNAIEFARIEDGLYEIVDENDAAVYGDMSPDQDLRGVLNRPSNCFEKLGLNAPDFATHGFIKVRLSPDPVYGLLIKFIKSMTQNMF